MAQGVWGLRVSSPQAWTGRRLKVHPCHYERVFEFLCVCACGFPGSMGSWMLNP